MEKKFKFSDNPTVAKTVYGAIIAILCITAIVVGIVAANNRKGEPVTDVNPPASDEGGNTVNPPEENPDEKPGDEVKPPEEKLSFISPVTGRVMKPHSTSVPAYSTTLEAWKIHTGIDILTEEDAEVFAVESGEVRVFTRTRCLEIQLRSRTQTARSRATLTSRQVICP